MKNSILDDHIRVKKKFIAPMNTIPQNGLYYFDEIVPEILWIAIIIHHLGISEAVREKILQVYAMILLVTQFCLMQPIYQNTTNLTIRKRN